MTGSITPTYRNHHSELVFMGGGPLWSLIDSSVPFFFLHHQLHFWRYFLFVLGRVFLATSRATWKIPHSPETVIWFTIFALAVLQRKHLAVFSTNCILTFCGVVISFAALVEASWSFWRLSVFRDVLVPQTLVAPDNHEPWSLSTTILVSRWQQRRVLTPVCQVLGQSPSCFLSWAHYPTSASSTWLRQCRSPISTFSLHFIHISNYTSNLAFEDLVRRTPHPYEDVPLLVKSCFYQTSMTGIRISLLLEFPQNISLRSTICYLHQHCW